MLKDKILKLIATSANSYELADRICELWEQQERDFIQTIEERDNAEQWADKLAFAIGGEQIGEHSNINNPWKNALGIILSSLHSTHERECNCANKMIDCLNCANGQHDEHCEFTSATPEDSRRDVGKGK